MRIGVLTYHCVPNFGAQLQTISTVGFLKKNGFEPIVLHWYPEDVDLMYQHRVPLKQLEIHNKFAKEFMPLSRLCRTEGELINEIERLNLDGIITGSDALFKYVPHSKRWHFSKRKMRFLRRKVLSVEDIVENPFFCDYYEKLYKKIPICAFSVSSQNCPFGLLNMEEKKVLGINMSNFEMITVRDEWTKKMVKFLTNSDDVQVTPDPVFAFNINSYIDLPNKEDILNKYSIPSKYVLLSFRTSRLSEKYVENIVNVLEVKGYAPVAFPMPEGLKSYNTKYKIELPLSPIDWYALIKYSSGYIGERMHPIVVALHNAIPFFCFDEYGIKKSTFLGMKSYYEQESSKTFHILNKAGLTQYLYSYKGNSRLPSPYEVVDTMLSFDSEKCQLFANEYYQIYNKSMNDVLKVITSYSK